MGSIFDSKPTKKKKSYLGYDETQAPQKSSISFMSEMQGILAEKEANEAKAATLLADYLMSVASRTYDETTINNNLKKMLDGFTLEEQNRILTKALVISLTRVS